MIINNIVHTHLTIITGVEAIFLTFSYFFHFLPSSLFSILGYHFSFSLPITVDIPTAHRRNPCGQKGKGHHVIHVTGTARDTQRYTVTRDASNHFLSFTVSPFYLDSFDSRYLLFAESLLFCYFFPPRSVENERRTRVTNFL